MKISLIRIDERLIHGQVTMGWARTASANLILAVNDLVAKDPFQKKLMMMAAPVGATVEIYSVDEVVEKLNSNNCADEPVVFSLLTPSNAPGTPFESVYITNFTNPAELW